jgi:hypothetical protein
MGNIAKAREGYKPPTGTVQVVLDVELARERNTLLQQQAQEEQTLSTEIDRVAAPAAGRTVPPKLKKLRDEMVALQQRHREQLEALTEREREHLHKLHMTKLAGVEWSDLADKFPPRLDVQFDIDLGYNHHAVAIAAARRSTVDVKEALPEGAKRDPEQTYVEVGGVVHRAEPLDEDDWNYILEIASGWDISNIINLQINLNVLQASNRLGRLKKD